LFSWKFLLLKFTTILFFLGTANCFTTYPLADASGNFLTNICPIGNILSYTDAVAACEANGMTLIDVSDPTISDALLAAFAIFKANGPPLIPYQFYVLGEDLTTATCQSAEDSSGAFVFSYASCDGPYIPTCGYM
jgi:hypothetical protein